MTRRKINNIIHTGLILLTLSGIASAETINNNSEDDATQPQAPYGYVYQSPSKDIAAKENAYALYSIYNHASYPVYIEYHAHITGRHIKTTPVIQPQSILPDDRLNCGSRKCNPANLRVFNEQGVKICTLIGKDNNYFPGQRYDVNIYDNKCDMRRTN